MIKAKQIAGQWACYGLMLMLVGCASAYGVRFYQKTLPKTISDGQFDVVISALQTDLNDKDYFMKVQVKNISQSTAVFDSGKIEVTNLSTGNTHFSISKDKSNMTFPPYLSDVIATRELRPGQSTTGRIWIETGPGDAKADRIRITFGSGSLELAAD